MSQHRLNRVGDDCFRLILQYTPIQTIVNTAVICRRSYGLVNGVAMRYLPEITIYLDSNCHQFIRTPLSTYIPRLSLWGFERDTWVKFVMIIRHVKNLRELEFNDLQLDAEGMTLIAQNLVCVPRLRSLSLLEDYNNNINNIGDQGIEALSKALSSVPQLQHLHLIGNCLGDQGIEVLVKNLHYVPMLSSLELVGNQITDLGMAFLTNSFVSLPMLQLLNLANNQIKGMETLVEKLVFLPELEELFLFGNLIGDDGVLVLAQGLPFIPKLRDLYLGHNQISYVGIQSLCTQLVSIPRLKNLNLKWNQIGDRGTEYLSEVLSHLPQLWILDISCNQITDKGLGYLIKSHIPQLKRLNIGDNQIKETELLTKKLIPSMLGLQQLWLRNNGINDAQELTLRQLCQTRNMELKI